MFSYIASHRPRAISDADYIRSAITRARMEGMSLADVEEAAEHAATPKTFDEAIAMMADNR